MTALCSKTFLCRVAKEEHGFQIACHFNFSFEKIKLYFFFVCSLSRESKHINFIVQSHLDLRVEQDLIDIPFCFCFYKAKNSHKIFIQGCKRTSQWIHFHHSAFYFSWNFHFQITKHVQSIAKPKIATLIFTPFNRRLYMIIPPFR